MTEQKAAPDSAQARSVDTGQTGGNTQPCRHENNSASVTPKDIDPGMASAKDVIERHLDSTDPEERQQELLDEAIDLTFPASDPLSVASGITRINKPASRSPR
jgi:hypothetical protein